MYASSTSKKTVGLLEDFKSIYYQLVESDILIQNLEEVINRLKYLHDGYLMEKKLKKAIGELETLKTELIEDKNDSKREYFKIETQITTLILNTPN